MAICPEDFEPRICGCCKELMAYDYCEYIDSTGDYVCNDCIAEYFHKCEYCEDVFHEDNLTKIDGYLFCSDCLVEYNNSGGDN